MRLCPGSTKVTHGRRGPFMAESSLTFRLLGPLEVLRGAALIRIEAPQQRVLLAALLLEADRIVPADRLMELLWGDEPPAKPRNALQTLIRRLRMALERPDAAE